MFSDPFTCQSRAYTGGSIQPHRDGRNTAGRGKRTGTVSQSVKVATRENKDFQFQVHFTELENFTTDNFGTRSRPENKTCKGLFPFTRVAEILTLIRLASKLCSEID